MLTKHFTTLILLCFTFFANAQLYTPSGIVNSVSNGSTTNVGIGISSPQATLDVFSSAPWAQVRSTSNAGIYMAVSMCDYCGSNSALTNDVLLSTSMGNSGNLLIQAKNSDKSIKFITNYNNFQGVRMMINHDGRVAIGHTDFTKSTGYMLSVAGKIMCEEVRVKLYANWPDFVFAKEYKLRSLDEVETYINENNHLPDVPSAEEVKNNGIEAGEMFRIQMQKIEELTLYVLQLKKENEELRKMIESK